MQGENISRFRVLVHLLLVHASGVNKKHILRAGMITVYCNIVLREKHGFAQSRDYPVQTLDPWFGVQTMDWKRNPGTKHIDQDNPGIAQISRMI